MMINLKEFISKYDFEDSIKYCIEQLGISKPETIIFIKNNKEIRKFAEDYWNNPEVTVSELKNAYNVPNKISYIDILRFFYNSKYEELLNDIWKSDLAIDELLTKYCLKLVNINSINVPIIYKDDKVACPSCLRWNGFKIDGKINDIKSNKLTCTCLNCNIVIREKDLLPQEIAQHKIEETQNRKKQFKEFINGMKLSLEKIIQGENIKCPKCQSNDFIIIENECDYKYSVKCVKCSTAWNDIASLQEKYSEWKQRAAMMIALKAKEQQIIDNALKTKLPENTLFKMSNIVLEKEGTKPINFMLSRNNLTQEKMWIELYSVIKICSRVELLTLIHIAELCKEKGKMISWTSSDMRVQMKEYTPDENSIYVLLLDKLGFLNLRSILRKLIEKNLIVISEENNYIQITPIIINNLDKVIDLTIPQSIEVEIKNLVLKRHNYTCYHCGETSKPLKIAYLNIKKTIYNINELAPLCIDCWNDTTIDEILIDGTLSDVNEERLNTKVSWNFLCHYLSEVQESDNAKDELNKLLVEYSEDEVIKALAVTINKFRKDENFNTGSMSGFFKYAFRVLETGVKIYGSLENDFQLNEWINKI